MRLLLLSIIFVLSACQAAPPKSLSTQTFAEKEQLVLKQMHWLKTANAEKQARDSIKNRYFKLYAISARVLRIPGLTLEQKNSLKPQCKILPIKGTGDTLYGKQHLEMRKLAAKFALQHNKIMLPYCL